jgi:hypothetical protein
VHAAKTVAIPVFLLTLMAASASPEHLLVFCDGAALTIAIWALWPVSDAPILLLPFGLQWLSVAMKPLESALTGQPLDSLADFRIHITDGASFGLAGVCALGLGLWFGSRQKRVDWSETLSRDASSWSAGFVVPVSIALIVVGEILNVVAYSTGPATQIFLAFAEGKNIGLFVLSYWCLKTGNSLWILAAVTAVEIIFGMTGFFANFRETFLVLLIAAAAARPRLNLGGLLAVGGVFAAMLVVTVFWTSMKNDYRAYLNQGTHEQVVDRSLSDRLGYVGDAADAFDENQFSAGLRKLAARISYIDFLSSTLQFVPQVRPHEDGRRLGEALTNIAEPRIFFPSKPPTPNDTTITARYTGIPLDDRTDASISIGWLGELYIDFGYAGALLGAFVFGVLAGLGFRVIRSFNGVPMYFSYGAASMALLPFGLFETDLVRFMGSAITVFLGALILQRGIGPQILLAVARREARAHPA